MADENAHETVVLLDTIELTRATNKDKDNVTVGSSGVPRKEDDDEHDDVENVDDSSELAAGVPADVYRDTQPRNKTQQHQQPQQRKRHGARNQHKMKHFVRWLLETFPDILAPPPSSSSASSSAAAVPLQVASSRTETNSSSRCPENSNEDTGAAAAATTVPPPTPPMPLILDVAGGKGELAARLCLCTHLRVVLVDPRPANIEQTYQQTVVPRLPKKWQERLQQRLATNPNHVQDILNNKFHQVVDYFSYRAATTMVVWNNDNDEPEGDYTKQQQHQNILRLQQAVQDASLLIGMHADGATEDIIDVALHYQKPFVVVPCCVFANRYSHRQVRRIDVVSDDKTATTNTTCVTEEQQQPKLEPLLQLPEMTFASVRTHEQFCQYLLDKDTRFQKSILPFEGRNVAIWWNGK